MLIEDSRIVMLSLLALIERNFTEIHRELTSVGHLLFCNSPKSPDQCLQIYKSVMNQYRRCEPMIEDSEKAHFLLHQHFTGYIGFTAENQKTAQNHLKFSKDFCEEIKKRAEEWKRKNPNAKNE